jgi:hypothetical protein
MIRESGFVLVRGRDFCHLYSISEEQKIHTSCRELHSRCNITPVSLSLRLTEQERKYPTRQVWSLALHIPVNISISKSCGFYLKTEIWFAVSHHGLEMDIKWNFYDHRKCFIIVQFFKTFSVWKNAWITLFWRLGKLVHMPFWKCSIFFFFFFTVIVIAILYEVHSDDMVS